MGEKMSDELINKRIEERRKAREKRQQRNKLLLVVIAVVLTFVVIISGVAIHNRNQKLPVDGTNVLVQTSEKETSSSTTESSTTETTTESTTKKPTENNSETPPKYEVVKKEPAPGSHKVATASIGVTGDILIHNDVLKAALTSDGNYDFNPMLSKVSPYYKKYNKMIANLEVTLGGAEKGYSSYPMFNTPDSIASALKNAGVDMVDRKSVV